MYSLSIYSLGSRPTVRCRGRAASGAPLSFAVGQLHSTARKLLLFSAEGLRMSPEVIAALIGLIGVIIGAIPTYLFMRQKNSAEVEKLKAETDKIKAAAERIRAEFARNQNLGTAEARSTSLETSSFIGLSAYGEDEVAEAFVKAAERIREAKNRVLILAGTMPPRTIPVQPRMPATRSNYLKAIEEVLKERLIDRKTHFFVYKRILQSLSLPFSETLRVEQVDEDMVAHCRNVFAILSLATEPGKIDFELRIRAPSPSCPAILVVDDDFVSLLIISEHQELQGGRMVNVVPVRSVITIEDTSGKTANHYARLIDNLTNGSTKINAVEA